MSSNSLDGKYTIDTLYTLGHIQEFDEYGASGVIMARGGGKFIRFDRYRVYINGVKFYSNRFLWQSLRIGTLLKVLTNVSEKSYTVGKIQTNYNALIAWTGELPTMFPLVHHSSLLPSNDKNQDQEMLDFYVDCSLSKISEMSGSIYWCCGQYGMIAVRSEKQMHMIFILFDPRILYIHGKNVERDENLQVLCARLGQCNLYAKPIKPQNVFGVIAEYEAILMWRGKKPPFNLIEGGSELSRNPPAYKIPTFNSYGNSSMKLPLLANPERPHINNFYPISENDSRYPNNDYYRRYKSLENSANNYHENYDHFSTKENTNPNSTVSKMNNYNESKKEFSNQNGKSNGYNTDATGKPHEIQIEQDILNKVNEANINKNQVSYFTGTVIEAGNDIALYGGFEKAAIFHRDDFYMYGEKLPPNQSLHSILKRHLNGGVLLLHSFVSEIEITPVLNWFAQWRAKYVWLGAAPPEVKEALSSVTKVPLNIRSISKYIGNNQQMNSFGKPENSVRLKNNSQMHKTPAIEAADIEYLLTTNKESMQEGVEESVKEDEVRGYILTADDNECIMTSFNDIIVFGRRKFYVNGKKFDKNGSLIDFFQGETVMVKAWIVPLENPRVVLNCVVQSRAICAWTGKPPEDLERLKQEYYSNRVSNLNPKVDVSSTGFYYFIGRLTYLDGESQCGILLCEKSKNLYNVSFSKSTVYKHGVKINEKHKLENYTLTLGSSRWSVLAHKIQPEYLGNNKVEFKAVAVWHFQNQNQLFDEFNQKLYLWSSNSSCNCHWAKKSENYEGIVLSGKVFTQYNKNIIVEVSIKDGNPSFAVIKRKNLWVDDCLCALSSADEKRKCYLVCFKMAEPEVVHGIEIVYEAFIGWIGVKPNHIHIDKNILVDDCCDEDEGNLYEEEEFEDDSDNFNTRTVNAYDPHTTDSNFNTPFQCVLKSTTKPRTHKFSGKHVMGKIKSCDSKYGIAEWTCAEKGTIYIAFDCRHMYVDTVKLSQKKVSYEILYERSCHLYVILNCSSNPITKHNGVLVKHQATVGWIGRKPSFIPGPGLQQNHDLNLFPVNTISFEPKTRESINKLDDIPLTDDVPTKVTQSPIKTTSKPLMPPTTVSIFEPTILPPSTRENLRNIQETITTTTTTQEFLENIYSTPATINPIGFNGLTSSRSFSPLSSIWNTDMDTLFSTTSSSNFNQTPSLSSEDTQYSFNDQVLKNIFNNPNPNDNLITPTYHLFNNISSSYNLHDTKLKDEINYTKLKDDASKMPPIKDIDISLQNCQISSLSSKATSSLHAFNSPLFETPFVGTLVELYSNAGVIRAENNQTYYFNANQCYLYGASLKNVELWHVLIKEIKVNYTLKNESGILSCELVWIGNRYIQDYNESIALVNKWCSDNVVPEQARNIILSDLKN